MVGTVNGRSQCGWRIIGSGFLGRWSRKIGGGDLSQMLESRFWRQNLSNKV